MYLSSDKQKQLHRFLSNLSRNKLKLKITFFFCRKVGYLFKDFDKLEFRIINYLYFAVGIILHGAYSN